MKTREYDPRELNRRGRRRAVRLLAAAAVLVFPTFGCSGQEDETRGTNTRAANTGTVEPIASGTSTPVAVPAPSPVASPVAIAPPEEGATEVSGNDLPPDLVATASATEVTPGGIIEITAKGSSDVVEMILSDGMGKVQTLSYDASATLWRTRYRVPMRMPSERLGLSVTAKNGGDHWRRVWLFLTPGQEVASVDSVSGS